MVSSFLLGSCLLFGLIFLDVDALGAALPDFFEQINRHTFVASPAHWLLNLLLVKWICPRLFIS